MSRLSGALALVLALAAAGGATAQPPALAPFQEQALRAIYAVLPHERERFALSPSPDSVPVVLYTAGPKPDQPDLARIPCASNATFSILAHANEAGTIAVSSCPEHLARLRALAAESAQGFDAMLGVLQQNAPPMAADKLRAAGWYRERLPLSGGGELHYLTIIAVGHGVAFLPTVVLLTDTQAVAVQVETSRLCRPVEARPSPLCAEPQNTLSAIAQRLLSPGH